MAVAAGARWQNEGVSGQSARYQRSAGGMVGALLVLVLVVGGYVAFRELVRTDPPSPVKEVDYARVVDFARETAPFALLAPESLPAGWRATSVDYTDGVRPGWHLGLLTDQDRYVGLEQARSSPEKMARTHVDEEAVPGEPVDVAGERWESWTDEDGDLALVRESDGTTTLVVGHRVPVADLVDFTASLR